MEAEKPKPKTVKTKTQWKPTYQKAQAFDSHLFKLTDAKMKKKVVLGNNLEDVQEVTHNHFYHTVDSSGRTQEHSVAVGGHFHIMTVEYDEETGEPIAKCSGPKTYTWKKNKRIIVDLPEFGTDERGEAIRDNHTHQVDYQRSSKVAPRTVSAEAVKAMDILETSRARPVEGIKG